MGMPSHQNQPTHNPTAPPREPRTIPAMPAAQRAATHSLPTGPTSPALMAALGPGGARERPRSQNSQHARTTSPRRAPLPAPPVHADALCSPFHPPAPPQPPPPVLAVGPSFVGLRSPALSLLHGSCLASSPAMQHTHAMQHTCNAAHHVGRGAAAVWTCTQTRKSGDGMDTALKQMPARARGQGEYVPLSPVFTFVI